MFRFLLALALALSFALMAGCNAAVAVTPDEGHIVDLEAPTHSPEAALTPAGEPASVPATSADSAAAPEETPEETPAPTPVPDNGIPYYLYVEKGSFTLTIYSKDENGEYTQVYRTYRIAHGGNKTPAGTYTLGGEDDRERWHDFPDGGTVQYATRYKNRLYIHSPLYATSDPRQLWPKYYDGEHGIGLESTGGCLRMVTEAAKFIYENCPAGTTLEIVNGSPKGTTSEDVPSRNGKRIDPTDVEALG